MRFAIAVVFEDDTLLVMVMHSGWQLTAITATI
jgi:hypothetical protein